MGFTGVSDSARMCTSQCTNPVSSPKQVTVGFLGKTASPFACTRQDQMRSFCVQVRLRDFMTRSPLARVERERLMVCDCRRNAFDDSCRWWGHEKGMGSTHEGEKAPHGIQMC